MLSHPLPTICWWHAARLILLFGSSICAPVQLCNHLLRRDNLVLKEVQSYLSRGHREMSMFSRVEL